MHPDRHQRCQYLTRRDSSSDNGAPSRPISPCYVDRVHQGVCPRGRAHSLTLTFCLVVCLPSLCRRQSRGRPHCRGPFGWDSGLPPRRQFPHELFWRHPLICVRSPEPARHKANAAQAGVAPAPVDRCRGLPSLATST